jgi:hypothetical protein
MHPPKKVDADFLHKGIRSPDLEIIRHLAKSRGLAEEKVVKILEEYHAKRLNEEGEIKPNDIKRILKNCLGDLLA